MFNFEFLNVGARLNLVLDVDRFVVVCHPVGVPDHSRLIATAVSTVDVGKDFTAGINAVGEQEVQVVTQATGGHQQTVVGKDKGRFEQVV